MTQYGQLNIHLGWITIVLGIITGSIHGMWAFSGPFKAPKGHKDYADLPRRLNRLAHIAFFMLPLISVVYGQHLDLIPVADNLKVIASYCWIVCMWGVPVFLTLASFYLPFKYFEVIPVSCGMVSLFIMAYGHFLLLTA
ncbi:MAG: hypothetical protein J0M15_16345 [Deltaproteobacteria bacterium]|jgi:hypothetical protein|nr:hypothetical protein [Deltaproteobacteria bacterium]